MTPERWQKAKEIFQAALDYAPGDRSIFLARACEGDESLRREVESLIESHEKTGSFIDSPVYQAAAKMLTEDQVLKAGQTVAHYTILSPLGRGGMGEVYLAEDTRLERKVALKILPTEVAANRERMRRFVQEAKAASALNHPNIVTIHEIGDAEAGSFIVMEYVVGRTLRRMMDEGLDLNALAPLGAQMARALSVAHASGITHRDIKPENVMVRDDGIVKLLDFGVARLLSGNRDLSEAETLAHTTPGVVVGTARYMSPEQALGERVTPASDIFSLGLVFFEMATGRHAFQSDSMIGILHSIISASPTPTSQFNPQVPAVVEALILRMLDKDANARPTATDVDRTLSELGEIREGIPLDRLARPTVKRHTVGRETERREMRMAFESARSGRGVLLCVAGEPGIGKTTVIEDFLSELPTDGSCAIARGRCSERLAGTEAYLPLLEALESLLQSGSNPSAATLMKQIAPTWYAQLVPLSGSDEESTRLLNEVRGASQERMKRELGGFLQEASRIKPLVLFFDDLHWADISTIDVLNFLAGKFDSSRILIVTAYRPSDMLLSKHPFLQIKPDLQARGVCRELLLEFLNREEVSDYLALEFPGHSFPDEFPKLIHAKTEGSPLFMADLVRYLRDRNVIAQTNGRWTLAQEFPDIERDLPESVRGMIERKIAQLTDDDRKLLVTASVQGYEFDSAVLARVLKVEADELEERLEALERVQTFVKLLDEHEFPDRTLTLRYRFVHILYQNALYSSLRSTRKITLSREVAEGLESFYGERRTEAASELASLWETARDYRRATECFILAAQHSNQVMAAHEAAVLARRGLRTVEMLPESRERLQQELSLQVILGNAWFATKGYAAPEVEETYARAHELGQQLGEPQRLLPLLWGLYAVSFCRPRYPKALAYGEEFLRLADRHEPATLVVGYAMVGTSHFWLGELEQARDYLQRSVSLYTPAEHRPLTWVYGHEPGMYAEIYLADTLWVLGYPDQALAHIAEFHRLGLEVSQAQSQAFALAGAAHIYQWCGNVQRVGELVDQAYALCTEQGLPFWLGFMTIMRGWVTAMRGVVAGGIEEMRRGVAAVRSTGGEITLTINLCRLAEAHGKAGQPREGLAVLTEALALAERSEERCWEADLYRVKGELLHDAGGNLADVEALFHKGIEIARQQRAKSLELRAAMSLARLWQQQGKQAEARQMLADIYGWFTEGFETLDLKEAKRLLKDLRSEDRSPKQEFETGRFA